MFACSFVKLFQFLRIQLSMQCSSNMVLNQPDLDWNRIWTLFDITTTSHLNNFEIQGAINKFASRLSVLTSLAGQKIPNKEMFLELVGEIRLPGPQGKDRYDSSKNEVHWTSHSTSGASPDMVLYHYRLWHTLPPQKVEPRGRGRRHSRACTGLGSSAILEFQFHYCSLQVASFTDQSRWPSQLPTLGNAGWSLQEMEFDCILGFYWDGMGGQLDLRLIK